MTALHRWEQVAKETLLRRDDIVKCTGVRRLRVPSGWLYCIEESVNCNEFGGVEGRNYSTPVFVPDPPPYHRSEP